MSTDTKENHLHESFVSTFVNKAPLLCCRPRPLLLLYLGDWSTCAVGPAHCCYCTLAIGRRGTIAYEIWLRSQYYWWWCLFKASFHLFLACPQVLLVGAPTKSSRLKRPRLLELGGSETIKLKSLSKSQYYCLSLGALRQAAAGCCCYCTLAIGRRGMVARGCVRARERVWQKFGCCKIKNSHSGHPGL